MFLSIIITSSFRSAIFSCFSLILLLPNIASSEVLFRYGIYRYFQICLVLGQFSRKQFFYCSSWLCLLWLYCGLWLIYSSSFWKYFSFLLSFFSISNNNIPYLFQKCVIYLKSLWCCSIFDASTRKWWAYYRLNGFQFLFLLQHQRWCIFQCFLLNK